MGLEAVIEDIRRASERRAQEILSEASQEADRILGEAKETVQAYERERAAQAEKDTQQLRAQSRSHAQFEARKATLTTEVALRDELRDEVLQAFRDLPAARREKHVKALLSRAQDVIPKGTVYGAAADEKTLRSQKSYKYGGTRDIAGGIIVESEDGLVRLDLSYETLLGDLWRDVLRQEQSLFA